MRDIYIKLDNGEIRKVNKKKLLGLILVLLAIISIITCGIVSIVRIAKKPAGQAEQAVNDPEEIRDVEPIMGDIFSRGYYAKNSDEVLSAQMSEVAMERLQEYRFSEEKSLITAYENLKRDNPDFAGYLLIEGTEIDYPVMYTPNEPEKYLYKDINGKDSNAGLPFIDARCSVDPDSDNIIIYGHNMRNGSMFGDLELYENEDYCKEHPVIRFDSPYEEREYEVVAALYDRVYYTDEDDERFYDFIDAEDEKDFNKKIGLYLEKSLYDTGIHPQYGDKLITLVTCSYQEDNGRFAVMARRIGN